MRRRLIAKIHFFLQQDVQHVIGHCTLPTVAAVYGGRRSRKLLYRRRS